MIHDQALNDLKTALLGLDATGKAGFEGLLAVALGKVTGHEFRLAGSGSQHGKDGESVAAPNSIAFEGKLYTGEIPKNEVLSKATEIIGAALTPDVWVLGATVALKTQIADVLESAFSRNAIASIVLDWPETVAIPPLSFAWSLAKNA